MSAPLRVAVVAAGVLCATVRVEPASQASPYPKPPCSDVRVMEQSFQQLPNPSRNAYVWVDDIDSRILGGYHPFQVYVLMGGTYSPFQAKSGRLDRATFERLSKSTYNGTVIGPLTVTADSVQAGKAVLKFTSGGYTCVLKILSVTSRLFNGDALQLQMCW